MHDTPPKDDLQYSQSSILPYYQDALVTLYLADCLPAMREMPDKAFDLAIVDPEYGADLKGPCGRLERYGGIKSVNSRPPTPEYFRELFRITHERAVWGANYFELPPCKCFIIWDKKQPQSASYAQAEYAWTNFDGTSKIYEQRVIGADDCRIHPTQKPVALYRWLLTNYAKPGQTILDTHLGSGSIAIACHDLGYSLTGYEIDEEYLAAAVYRIKRYLKQPKLFKPEVKPQEQEGLFA